MQASILLPFTCKVSAVPFELIPPSPSLVSSNSIPGCTSEENAGSKGTCTPNFQGSVIYSSLDMKQFECLLSDGWIKKWHVCVHTDTHVHNRIFSAIERMKSCLCNNVNEPKSVMLSEASHT